jgi:hypothetical protein
MKKVVILFFVVALVACSNTPKKDPFPKADSQLFNEPRKLDPINLDSNVKLSDVMSTVVKNYEICHENSTRLRAWQEWYKQEEKLYNSNLSSK